MLKDPMTIPPEVANQIIRDLGQIEVDMLSILANLNKNHDAVVILAKNGATTATKLAKQFAGLRMPEGRVTVVPEAPKVRTRRRNYVPKATGVVGGLPDFSGSLLSMLLHST